MDRASFTACGCEFSAELMTAHDITGEFECPHGNYIRRAPGATIVGNVNDPPPPAPPGPCFLTLARMDGGLRLSGAGGGDVLHLSRPSP